MNVQHLRLILVLFLLLIGGGPNYAFSSETPQDYSDKAAVSELSEDFQELSPSHISTSITFLHERFFPDSHNILSEENCREYSRNKAYLSESLLIEPGLSPPDIIFPFHTFL